MGNLPSKSKPKSKHRPNPHGPGSLSQSATGAQHGSKSKADRLQSPAPRSNRLASISSTESAHSAVSSLAVSLSGSDSAASLSSRHRRHLTLHFAPPPCPPLTEKATNTSPNYNKLWFVDPSFCLDAAVSLHFKFARASTSPVPIAYLGAFDDLTDDLPPFPPAAIAAAAAATMDPSCDPDAASHHPPPQVWFTCHDHSGVLSVARTLVDSQGTPILHYHNADVYRGPPPGMHARCLQVTSTATKRGGKISVVARPTDPTVQSGVDGEAAAFMLTLQAKERDDVKYIRASPYADVGSGLVSAMDPGTALARIRKRTQSAASSTDPGASSPPEQGAAKNLTVVSSQAQRHATSPKLAAKGARRGDPIVARIRRQLLPAPESAVAKAKKIVYVVDVAPGVDVAAIAAMCMYVHAAEAKCRAKRSQSSVGQLVS